VFTRKNLRPAVDSRPQFVARSEGGCKRGTGQSTLVALLLSLCGRRFEDSHRHEFEQVLIETRRLASRQSSVLHRWPICNRRQG
jgi:hypothetical protein